MPKSPTIQLITPSIPLYSDQHLATIVETLESYGCTVRKPSVKTKFLDYAGTVEERTNEIVQAVQDPNIDVLWQTTGVVGCAQVMAALEKANVRLTGKAKTLIGFSDITNMVAWWQYSGWSFIHGVMAGFNQETHQLTHIPVAANESLKPVVDIIAGKTTKLSYKLPTLIKGATNKIAAHGLSGGCLDVLKEATAAPFRLQGKERMLFFECYQKTEPAERAREILNLARSGIFNGAQALILGTLELQSKRYTPEQLLPHFTNELTAVFNQLGISIPVVHSPLFGHGERNQPLPFDWHATLTVKNDTATLSLKNERTKKWI